MQEQCKNEDKIFSKFSKKSLHIYTSFVASFFDSEIEERYIVVSTVKLWRQKQSNIAGKIDDRSASTELISFT